MVELVPAVPRNVPRAPYVLRVGGVELEVGEEFDESERLNARASIAPSKGLRGGLCRNAGGQLREELPERRLVDAVVGGA